jgi:hypothetical protein
MKSRDSYSVCDDNSAEIKKEEEKPNKVFGLEAIKEHQLNFKKIDII